jgi:tetratricopeptide (TPR) repeat protein
MNKFILILLLSVFSLGLGISQSIDEEIEFKYIKAKYLLDTERYEDAIKEFTAIIEEDKSYKDVIIQRARAKYAMAAYRGTKKDVLLFAVNNGINADALMLLGKADYKMGNSEAAINSLLIASQLIDDDPQIFEFLGNLYDEEDKVEDACRAWRKAAKMGSSKASINAKKACGDIEDEERVKKNRTKVKKPTSKMDGSTLPTKTKVEKPTSGEEPDEMGSGMEDTRTEEQKRRDADDSLNSPTKDSTVGDDQMKNDDENIDEEPKNEDTTTEDDAVIEDDEDSYNMPEEDNTPNEIEIDEDLTLIIRGQGLGKRKVLDQPNILILSDEDGTVSIDICVNKRGKVESAEFNSKLSTIAKKSLVSLAIRKSKDFWFEKNDYNEQCGVIMFKIKGS